ncbi:MAG: alpha-ketoglutarate-dependent dioxygenase AlkB [Bacteroidota bacterium]
MRLALNCEAAYHDDFLTEPEASDLFGELLQVVQQIHHEPSTVDGTRCKVNFGKVMFIDQQLMDKNVFPEAHWGATRIWFGRLAKLKARVEEFTGRAFQVCVLIYYPDGHAGVDFHTDYPAFGDTSLIPSVSLGEERVFKFREKASGEVLALALAHGSLVIMGAGCQEHYEHSLPVDAVYKNPRINLTFRKYGFAD